MKENCFQTVYHLLTKHIFTKQDCPQTMFKTNGIALNDPQDLKCY